MYLGLPAPNEYLALPWKFHVESLRSEGGAESRSITGYGVAYEAVALSEGFSELLRCGEGFVKENVGAYPLEKHSVVEHIPAQYPVAVGVGSPHQASPGIHPHVHGFGAWRDDPGVGMGQRGEDVQGAYPPLPHAHPVPDLYPRHRMAGPETPGILPETWNEWPLLPGMGDHGNTAHGVHLFQLTEYVTAVVQPVHPVHEQVALQVCVLKLGANDGQKAVGSLPVPALVHKREMPVVVEGQVVQPGFQCGFHYLPGFAAAIGP